MNDNLWLDKSYTLNSHEDFLKLQRAVYNSLGILSFKYLHLSDVLPRVETGTQRDDYVFNVDNWGGITAYKKREDNTEMLQQWGEE